LSEPGRRDTTGLQARKQPTQERSKHLVASILQATTRVVEEDGDDWTIERVCVVAGVSPGSFYQYFQSRDAVVYALLRRHAEEVTASMAEVLAAGATGQVDALISSAVHAFIEAHRAHPRLHVYLGRVVAAQAGPGLEEDLMGVAEAAVGSLLAARQAELGTADPEVTGFLLMRTLEGAVHAACRDRPELLETAAFADGIERMLWGLVGR
jgi:AcrR family transcriptional regulator